MLVFTPGGGWLRGLALLGGGHGLDEWTGLQIYCNVGPTGRRLGIVLSFWCYVPGSMVDETWGETMCKGPEMVTGMLSLWLGAIAVFTLIVLRAAFIEHDIHLS